MNIEKPYKSSIVIEETMSGVAITIPAKSNFFKTLFLIVFLSFWLFAGGSVLNNGASGSGFVLIWLCLWFIALIKVASALSWNLIGKEVITIENDVLTIKKIGNFFGGTKSYAISEAKKFRVMPDNINSNNINITFSFGERGRLDNPKERGTIVFDYGMESIDFGLGISEPEAKHILKLLKEKDLIP